MAAVECVTVIELDDGRIIVPDNRWDLVGDSSPRPLVSVVIPYYNQPHQLGLVLEALTAQTYPADRLEVVVADDGSTCSPDVSAWTSRLILTVVTQEDKGFRAAAARNLGVAASSGSVLCFLDADTVPTADYVRHAVRLPAAVPDALVVGRRKHADLGQVVVDSVVEWLRGRRHLENSHDCEPGWLVDAYDRTSSLLAPGWDSYKYLISAVMTCSRTLFDDVGGFDPSFVRYGGEDWELANRAFMMGAVFAHEPRAVAWHDGPDWADRSVRERISEKNSEALALAPLVTDPAARTAGLSYEIPDIVVLVSTEGHTAASLMQTVGSALRGVDGAVWLVGARARSLYDQLGVHDSRVRIGRPDASTLSRCRFVAEIAGPVVFSESSLALLTAHVAPGECGQVTVDFDGSPSASVIVAASRARHRVRRWAAHTDVDSDELLRGLFGVRTVHHSEVEIDVADGEPSLSW
ncbi:Glycosyltransferases involved in cell wall biogenesis [Gordonia terrae C-6]|uniref:Glycosyltransferases involved in cell wall biogenesis n=1 Tax=Gordonia terrae C-6 TaxID=1316928 RepID=R7YAD0_9ACTN|nr:Glycosyltransferases involved in cell wall biogenesis [Gordonia terrae C-6]